MNQDYKDRMKRHLEADGDPKYVNVKRKALEHRETSHNKALNKNK